MPTSDTAEKNIIYFVRVSNSKSYNLWVSYLHLWRHDGGAIRYGTACCDFKVSWQAVNRCLVNSLCSLTSQ